MVFTLNMQFNPHIVHIDYSESLRKALLTENLFKSKPIIIHCFFHFVQNVKKMKAYGIIKKKTKYNFEIIKNIEVICLLPPKFIKTYKKFIESKLTTENEIKYINI